MLKNYKFTLKENKYQLRFAQLIFKTLDSGFKRV